MQCGRLWSSPEKFWTSRMYERAFEPFGYRLWSVREKQVILDLFPDRQAIYELLPNRSRSSVNAMIIRLHRPHARPAWTPKEQAIVRRLYPFAPASKIRAALPDRTFSAVKKWAQQHHIYRRRRPYKPTGILLIDQIRDRCFELGYTMRDLDALIGSRHYFRQGQFRSADKTAEWALRKGRHHHPDVGKAVRALGGHLTAVWDDDQYD